MRTPEEDRGARPQSSLDTVLLLGFQLLDIRCNDMR